MSKTDKTYGTLPDAELVALSKNGDDSAFNEWAMRYISLINHIAKKYSASGYEQNDFLQEGLIGLLYSSKTFHENAGMTFKNYLSVIVERRFISIIRKSNSQRIIPAANVVNLDDLEEEPKALTNNPEEYVMYREYLDSLLKNLKNILSDTEYKVLMMFCSGQSYKQIAEKLSVSVKSVDNAMQRARRKTAEKNMSQ